MAKFFLIILASCFIVAAVHAQTITQTSPGTGWQEQGEIAPAPAPPPAAETGSAEQQKSAVLSAPPKVVQEPLPPQPPQNVVSSPPVVLPPSGQPPVTQLPTASPPIATPPTSTAPASPTTTPTTPAAKTPPVTIIPGSTPPAGIKPPPKKLPAQPAGTPITSPEAKTVEGAQTPSFKKEESAGIPRMKEPHVMEGGVKSDLPPGWDETTSIPLGGIKIEDLPKPPMEKPQGGEK